MGEFKKRITEDIKVAMKAGEKARLQVLRSVLAAIKSAQDDNAIEDLDEQDELALLMKAVKTRKETITLATAAGREDVATLEQAEVDVLAAYLPEMLTGDTLLQKVRELAAEVGYQGPKDKGRFMKEWMTRYRGQAAGREVQEALTEL